MNSKEIIENQNESICFEVKPFVLSYEGKINEHLLNALIYPKEKEMQIQENLHNMLKFLSSFNKDVNMFASYSEDQRYNIVILISKNGDYPEEFYNVLIDIIENLRRFESVNTAQILPL